MFISRFITIGLLFFAFTGCSSSNRKAKFPIHSEIKPSVQFWENVYAKWDLNVVIIHDNRYPQIIYKTIELPQKPVEHYTVESKKLVERSLEQIQTQIISLEEKLHLKQQLTSSEKKLVSQLKKAGGNQALININERVRAQRGLASRYKSGLERSYAYLPHFKKIFKQAKLPEDLAYLPHVESSFVNHAYSKVGAAGMWQFMPKTGKEYLPTNGIIDGRMDPIIAAQGVSVYFNQAYSKLKSWPLAITAYNYGIYAVSNAAQEHNDDYVEIVSKYKGKRFGFAVRNFYPSFLAARNIALSPRKYFPNYKGAKALDLDYIVLGKPTHPYDIAKQYKVSYHELKQINPSWLPINSRNIHQQLPEKTIVWLPKATLKK